MDVSTAIREMPAVRSYRLDPVESDIVDAVLEAGRQAGSSCNAQPWCFVVIRDHTTRASIASRLPQSVYVADAPVTIAVCVEDNDGWGRMDGARAIQSMLLEAWSHGLGSTWTAGPESHEIVNDLLDLPNGIELLGFVPLGYPSDGALRPKRRKPLTSITYRERFGVPYFDDPRKKWSGSVSSTAHGDA
jgi:nitroreductase